MVALIDEFGSLLVPVLLGFVGVYLMLPRPRDGAAWAGAILGAVALVMAGFTFVRLETVLPARILFHAFSGLAILGGVLLITQKNPVHAAISFALVVLSVCGLFLLQGAPFLMGATIIIYAGAIVVTFLFVIMLSQQAGTSDADQRSREPLLSSLAGFVLIGALLCLAHRTYDTGALDKLQRITEAETVDQVIFVMGDPARMQPGDRSSPLVDQLTRLLPRQDEAISNLEPLWHQIRKPGKLAELKRKAQEILAESKAARIFQGTVTSAPLPLSEFGGLPPYKRVDHLKNATGSTLPEALPARNVAGLGTALYTDHLVAVELAGVLLLVATIGAIAIASRRPEGLR